MPSPEFQQVSDHDTQWMIRGLDWDDALNFLRRPYRWLDMQADANNRARLKLPNRCVIVLDHDDTTPNVSGTLMGVDGTAIMLMRGLSPIVTTGRGSLEVDKLLGRQDLREGFGLDDDNESDGKIILTFNQESHEVYMHLHLKVAKGDTDVDWLSVFAYRAARDAGFVNQFLRDHNAKLWVQDQNGSPMTQINTQTGLTVGLGAPERRRILFERSSAEDLIEGCAIGAGEYTVNGDATRITFNTLIFKLYPIPPIDG